MNNKLAVKKNPTQLLLPFADLHIKETSSVAVEPANSGVVKSVNSNQHAILRDIMNLHNDGKPFDCDMTFSKGKFYGQHGDIYIPEPRYKCDVAPLRDDIIKIEPDGLLPFGDGELDSIVVDLPFLLGRPKVDKDYKEGSYIISSRFSAYHTPEELYWSYAHWLTECYRVLNKDGLCVFKTQAVISSSMNHLTPYFSCYYAQKLGFVVDDEFILTAKTRLIDSRIKKQRHARKYHSSFLVLRKWDSKRYKKANIIEIISNI